MNNTLTPTQIKTLSDIAENSLEMRIIVSSNKKAKAVLQLLAFYGYKWKKSPLTSITRFDITYPYTRYYIVPYNKYVTFTNTNEFESTHQSILI